MARWYKSEGFVVVVRMTAVAGRLELVFLTDGDFLHFAKVGRGDDVEGFERRTICVLRLIFLCLSVGERRRGQRRRICGKVLLRVRGGSLM